LLQFVPLVGFAFLFLFGLFFFREIWVFLTFALFFILLILFCFGVFLVVLSEKLFEALRSLFILFLIVILFVSSKKSVVQEKWPGLGVHQELLPVNDVLAEAAGLQELTRRR